MKAKYRQFSCRTPVRQLPYVSNVLILSYRRLPEGTLCIALSAAFSCFKLFTMPRGGSVSLSLLSLLLFAFRRGPGCGVIVCFTAGALRLLRSREE
ncbi:MAG: energy-coupled thiamine transporter ThiT [Synergistes sp.]|nr:energy-coupled thiamine transporter ThiT [Synergistes sp.]